MMSYGKVVTCDGEEGGEAPEPVARLVKRASRVKVKSPGGRCSAWAVRQVKPEPVAGRACQRVGVDSRAGSARARS